ncbi:MAG: zinc ribbon domain-containing protein, partial [Deltaproteobacteria bacterium]|nr:zinc ribbon domain-containing protein [Deltaproteobacteria bacterium]
MALETKEQVLEKILSEKKPLCHHCGKEMSIWEVPPFSFSDGLGWGEPYLFVCFNNDCPVYLKGWDDIMDNYAHKASVRCMCYPSTKQFEYL